MTVTNRKAKVAKKNPHERGKFLASDAQNTKWEYHMEKVLNRVSKCPENIF